MLPDWKAPRTTEVSAARPITRACATTTNSTPVPATRAACASAITRRWPLSV